MRWRLAKFVVPSVLVIALAACGGSGAAKVATKKDVIAGLHANDAGSKDVTGVNTVTVQANEYYFAPSVLRGTPGQHLTLNVKNVGSAVHNFTLSAQNIDKNLETGKTVTLNVTFPASGVLSFYCSFHRNLGMAGGLLTSGSASG